MSGRNTMARLLAGDELSALEAAVFGAEFALARERHRSVPALAFCAACGAVDDLRIFTDHMHAHERGHAETTDTNGATP